MDGESGVPAEGTRRAVVPEGLVRRKVRVEWGMDFLQERGQHALGLSIPESSKKAYGILADPYPNLENFRCTLLRFVLLRKLDGSLRTQLELPRQPSEGCLLFGSFWSSGTWCLSGPALVQEEGVKHH